MSKIGKKFNQLKQWTRETIGKGERTEKGDEYEQLKADLEFRLEHTRIVYEALNEYGKSFGLKKSKNLTSEFGIALTSYGDGLGSSNAYGQALGALGGAYVDISNGLPNVLLALNNSYGALLYRYLQESSELERLHKKTNSRRLDYDAKAAKALSKRDSDSTLLDEDARLAKSKFESSVQECTLRMKDMQQSESEQLQGLFELVEAQEAYFQSAATRFGKLKVLMQAQKEAVSTRHPGSQSSSTNCPYVTPKMVQSRQASQHDLYHNPSLVSLVPESKSRFEQPIRAKSGDVGDLETSALSAISVAKAAALPKQRLGSGGSNDIPPSYSERYKVIYDFYPESADDLALIKGEIVVVMEKVSDGWWLGQVENQPDRYGMFPTNYVQPITLSSSTESTNSVQSSSYSVTPVKLVSVSESKAKPHPQGRISFPIPQMSSNLDCKALPSCSTCDCTNFTPNMFRAGYCNMCCHKH